MPTRGGSAVDSRNATSSLAELSLAGQSGLFSVPANGSVELRGLNITGAALPSAPYPLPASGFLALSAFRLGAGARLRLVDSVLTVPSCALLSLHQTYACGLSPSPNVTVTPSSLVVHRLTTPSLDAWNVTVQCSGAAAPFLCLAASFPSDVPLLSYLHHASQLIVAATGTFGGMPPPVYVFLKQDTVLVESSGSTSSSGSSSGGAPAACGGDSNGSSNTTASGGAQQPQQGFGANPDAVGGTQRAPEPAAACASIAWVSLLVLAGDASAQPRTALDLADSTSRLNLQTPDAKVEFRHLTLRNPPPGPPGFMPYSLLRLPIWTAAFPRNLYGSRIQNLLTLTDCTVELPPEEVALLYGDVVLSAAGLPPPLAELWCAADSHAVYNARTFNRSRFTDTEMFADIIIGGGARSVYTRVLLRAVWPPGWQRAAGGAASSASASAAALVQPGVAAVSGAATAAAAGAASPLPPLASAPLLGLAQGVDPEPTPENTAGAAGIATAAAGVASAGGSGGVPGTFRRYPSRPSLCAVLVPGKAAPVWLGNVHAVQTNMLNRGALDMYEQIDGPLGVDVPERAVVALERHAYLLASSDPFFAPSFGQAQSNVTVPSLVLGEPLSLRLLDFCGVSSAFVIAGGPRAALTLRWLVLVGLPAAGGLKQVPLGPTQFGRPVQKKAPAPPPVLQGGGGELDASGHSVTGRRLQQRAQGQLSNGQGGSGGALGGRCGLCTQGSLTEGPQQREGRRLRQLAGGGSVTQGLAPALANFTSCLWTYEFDRSPQALAADAAGGVGGRPAGLPRLQLDGVVLVVPEAELQLLGRVWAVSADLLSGRLSFSVDTDTGLAAALMSTLQSSALLGPDSSSHDGGASLRSIGMLVFSEVTWCGWTGYNVTLVTAAAAELLDAITALRADATSYGATASAPVLEGLVLPAVEFTAPAAADSAGGGMTSGAMGGGVAVPSVSPPPAAAAVSQAANPPQQVQPLPTADRSATGPAAAASQQQPDQQQASGGSSTDAVGRLPAGAPAAGGGASGAEATGGSVSAAKGLPVAGIVVACVGTVAIVCVVALLYVWQRQRRSGAAPLWLQHLRDRTVKELLAQDSFLNIAPAALGQASTGADGPDCGAGLAVMVARQRDGTAAISKVGVCVRVTKALNTSDTSQGVSISHDLAGQDPSCGEAAPADAASSSNSVTGGSHVPLRLLPRPSSTPVSARAQPAAAAAATAGLVVPPFCSSPKSSNAVVTGTAADQASSLPLTITGELGRGAQGVVYRGVWRGLDVAVKSVLFNHSKGGAQGPRAKQAVQEAAIAVSMAHPNIVATYTYQLQPLRSTSHSHSSPVNESAGPSVALESSDVPSSNGCGGFMGRVSFLDNPEAEVWKLTLIQELCDANSLRHCLQSGRLARGPQAGADVGAGSVAEYSTDGKAAALQRVPARTVLLLACDIARGLAHLHERGVVHADLSSNNVLLQSSRSGAGTASPVLPSDSDVGFVAKLCDFGLSGRLDVEADATHLSGPARRSSAYSAPELVAHGRSGPAGDVYAFGVVLWELALGLPLPAALARPESASLRAWLSEQARLAPADDDTLKGAEGGDQAAGPPLDTLALPPGLLWWPEHTPPALKALAAECLQPEPRLRPSSAAVLARLEQLAQHQQQHHQEEAAALRGTGPGRNQQLPAVSSVRAEVLEFWARMGIPWRGQVR
ncbi:hypothetical protein HYH02_006616 [Chlamydomonas schloesseri]|uniref:Protein kinase domain-containing protein n=1 Tax=Chlamydomonas schloesseri TaxID=2026947 RepID=A0A835W812_9CHLO|nr:hypothetical protein HYH02_006616 [Chlamydomonas schloesseri]|eukprot:KAG2439091.1 hypothetical protein HYH02_006616 [Chlamydomonas schloesseri]